MNDIKKRDMGIAGALIVIAQSVISFQSAQIISDDIQAIRQDLQDSNLAREQFFARKTEIAVISIKMDKMAEQLTRLKQQVGELQSDVQESYVMDGTFGCDNQPELTVL